MGRLGSPARSLVSPLHCRILLAAQDDKGLTRCTRLGRAVVKVRVILQLLGETYISGEGA